MTNKLEDMNVSYPEFIEGVKNQNSGCEAILSYHAAINLCKNGFGNNSLNSIVSATVVVWPLFAIIGALFFSAWYLSLVLVIPLHFKIARAMIFRSVWVELIGDGCLPYDTRESTYYFLIEHGHLWSDQWTPRKFNSLINLKNMADTLNFELDLIYARESESGTDERNISVKSEDFSKCDEDGNIKMLGHYSVIDYDKHDMDTEGQKLRTIEEFSRMAKRHKLDMYPELCKKIKDELNSLEYDFFRYQHGEFHPPDLTVCTVALSTIEKEIEKINNAS